MKKIFLTLALVVLSVSAFAQLSATAVSGSDGYFVGKGSYDLSFIPGLTIAPNAAIVKHDGMDDMYQVGLNVEAKVPLWDAVRVGAKGGYTPKRNDYSNYFYEGYAKINLESLLFHVVELDNLTLGAGARQTEHKFYGSPDYTVGETDGYVSLGGRKGGFDGSVAYTKALRFSGDRVSAPAWLDVPGFTAVTGGYLNYALSADLGYTYKIVRPYVNYTYLKRYDLPVTDNLAVGATVKVGIVAVNAAVEWFDVSNKNDERQTFYSINGGISF
ncbi:MAG: hypothetical protein II183_01990 [Elusimicrobiaceae bacterium]|nr:hypothetical protein [Elusimicrobiaceae bacterium]